MAGIVNELEIVSIQVLSMINGQELKIQLSWRLNRGMPCSYVGSYQVSLYEDGEQIACSEQKDEAGCCSQSVMFQGIEKKDAFYEISIGVPAEAGGTVSEKCPVILDTYKNVRGKYDGKRLLVTWDRQSALMGEGICSIHTNQGMSILKKVDTYASCLVEDSFYLREDEWFTVTLFSVNHISRGPNSESLIFYGGPITCTELDYKKAEDRKIGIEAVIDYDMPCQEFRVRIVSGESIFYTQEPISIIKDEYGNRLYFEIEEEKIPLEVLQKCRLKIDYVQKAAVSEVFGESGGACLARPNVSADAASAGKITMSWELPCQTVPSGYLVTDGETTWRTAQNTFDKVCGEGNRFCVAALFCGESGEYRGAFSQSVDGFRTGYYPIRDDSGKLGIHFKKLGFSEDKISLEIDERVFQNLEKTEFKNGGISIAGEAGHYVLEIETGTATKREDYRAFLNDVQLELTPGGFYLLTGILSRTLCQEYEDSTYFLCGYDPEKRCADVRPGMILQADIQSYLFQPELYKERMTDGQTANEQGFIPACCLRYEPIWDEAEGHLVFNRFIDGIARHMNLPETSGIGVTEAGGIGDLSVPDLRQPYFSILYPEEMSLSHMAHSMYLSDNVALLAADSYGKLHAEIDLVAEHPEEYLSLEVPAVIFRGRSVLSLLMEVNVNGQNKEVPVGTTMRQVLDRIGVRPHESVTLCRRDGEGILRPVFWNWVKGADAIPLMPGDCIVC